MLLLRQRSFPVEIPVCVNDQASIVIIDASFAGACTSLVTSFPMVFSHISCLSLLFGSLLAVFLTSFSFPALATFVNRRSASSLCLATFAASSLILLGSVCSPFSFSVHLYVCLL